MGGKKGGSVRDGHARDHLRGVVGGGLEDAALVKSLGSEEK